MTILTRKKAVLVKIESVYGTDSVPVGATDAVLVKSVVLTDPLMQQTADREIVQPFLGAMRPLVAGAFAKLTIELEVAGFGTAGPATPTPGYDALLRACALASTVTAGTNVIYTPVSSAFSSVTVYTYQDGTLHKIVGCFGDLETGLDDKGVPTYKITLTGIYVPVTDVAFPTVSVGGYQVPLIPCADNTTPVSIFGYAGTFKSFSLKFGNQVEMREYPGGVKRVLITDRKSSGSIEMEHTLVGTNNPLAQILTATPGPIAITHGTVVGNKVKFAVGQAVPMKPKFTDDQGIVNIGFDFTAPPSSASNDDFSITVS